MKVFIALSTATLGAAAVALPLAAAAGGAVGGGARPAMMSAPMGESWHGTMINPELIRGDSGGFGARAGGAGGGVRSDLSTGTRVTHSVKGADTRPSRGAGLAETKADRSGLADVRAKEGLAPPKSDSTPK
jgi:hypothetical protein